MTFHLSWLPGNLAYRLGWTLLHSLWEGAMIALLAAVLMACLRKRSAAMRCSMLMAMLGVMIAAFAATLVLSPSPEIRSIAQLTPMPIVSHRTDLPARLHAMNTEELHAVPASPPRTISRLQRLRIVLSTRIHTIAPILAHTWFVGVLLLILWRTGGLVGAQRLRTIELENADSQILGIAQRLAERLNLTGTFDIMISRLAPTAMVIGWWRPVILLPASIVSGLAPWQIESILAHELSHIHRRDYLVNLLQILAETLLFYHPAIWWMSRRIRLEREQACDDLAVLLCGNRTQYAESLAALEELRLTGSLAMAANGSDGRQLITRIRRILGMHEASPRFGRSSAALAAIVLAGAVALLSHQIITHAAGLRSSFVLHNDGPRLSPFTAVQWDGDTPRVQFQFEWYECVAIDDVPASTILDYLKQSKDFDPKKHFAEDLVEVMTQMGHAPDGTVRLNLRSLATGETITIPAAEMTEANRRLVLLADARGPSAPAPHLSTQPFDPAAVKPGDVYKLPPDQRKIWWQWHQAQQRRAATFPSHADPATQSIQQTQAELLIRLEQKRVDEWEREYQDLRARNESSEMAKDALKNLQSEYQKQLDMIARFQEAGLLPSAADRDLIAATRARAANTIMEQYSSSTKPADVSNLHIAEEMLRQGVDPLVIKAFLDKDAGLDRDRAAVAEAQTDYDSLAALYQGNNPRLVAARARLESERTKLEAHENQLDQEKADLIPSGSKNALPSVKLVVSPNQLYLDGTPTTWEALPELLKKVPNRSGTILAFAMASDQMTLAQHNEAWGRISQLAHELNFAYASDTGIKAPTTSAIIKTGDRLSIVVKDLTPGAEQTKTTTVDAAGTISLPLIEKIQAAGRTEAQLEQAIRQMYADQGIVKAANVSVNLVQAANKTPTAEPAAH
jgi:beta-lactamase regulating signal transducer with metallopeptidase domain